MTKDILYDFKSLICTDPDCLQFAKKEDDHRWWFIQIIDRDILDEYEGREEEFAQAYENGAIVNGIDKFGNKMYLLPNLYNRTKLLHFCLIVVCLYRMAL